VAGKGHQGVGSLGKGISQIGTPDLGGRCYGELMGAEEVLRKVGGCRRLGGVATGLYSVGSSRGRGGGVE